FTSYFIFSRRRRHTRSKRDWSSDVCSSDLLEGGKVGYGGAYFAGQRIVGCAVLIQIPGNLVEVAADPAVLGGQLPDSREQFIIRSEERRVGNECTLR